MQRRGGRVAGRRAREEEREVEDVEERVTGIAHHPRVDREPRVGTVPAGAADGTVELARDRQDRVADLFGVEPAGVPRQ